MPLVIPTPSRQLNLKNFLNSVAPQNQTLKLFSNNYTPVVTSIAADFTEATGGGYVAKSLLGPNWVYGDDGIDDAVAIYPQQTWVFTGPLGGTGIVYGYFIVQTTSGLLMWAERLASPYTPTVNGDALAITPRFQGGDLLP